MCCLPFGEIKRKEMSFCNFTPDSEERWETRKLSFPRLLPKDTVGSQGLQGGHRGTETPTAGPRKAPLAGCFFNQPRVPKEEITLQ